MNVRHRWLLPGLAGAMGVLGIGALVAAAILPPALVTEPAAGASGASPAETASPRPSSESGVAVPDEASKPRDGEPRPISELADPSWVSRIAEASDIPERAVAAYAGAALALSRSEPGCGIGWNTLAAIGFVESEHGTLQGGRIGVDGVAAPDVIGIPIGPDTDRGELDHDNTQDRAVGPMQFIPSSWALLGADGNQDGVADVHNIDDATLAAAIHLCDVGGDLTQPSNWINAVNAYNASVEYNNRVAEAADHYATLR